MLRFIYRQPDFKMAIILEATMMSNMIMKDLKFDYAHLMKCLKFHDLEEHTEKDKPENQRPFSTLRKQLTEDARLDEIAEIGRMQPDQEILDRMEEKLRDIGEIQYTDDIVDFDYFIKYQEMI